MEINREGTVNFSQVEQDIIDSFEHHVPNQEQIQRILNVRYVCKNAAIGIIANVPASADRTAALRKLHEAMMTANKAIANEKDA